MKPRLVLSLVILTLLLAPAAWAEDGPAWGAPVSFSGPTPYAVYKNRSAAVAQPSLVTDTRTEAKYAPVESFNSQTVTVYRAAQGQALLTGQPVILFVHGGAWTDGYADWYEFVAQSFSGGKGWVTAVVEYRLTSDQVFLADRSCPDRAACGQPESLASRTKAAWYPDNLHDVAAALSWVAANIADHGGDPRRIVIFGHSAGGHLVSLLATHPDYAAWRPWLKGVVAMSGAYQLTAVSQAAFGDALDQTFTGGRTDQAQLAEASPAGYVSAGAGLPPFYVLHAGLELPSLQNQAVNFYGQLLAAQLQVEHDVLLGYSHESEMEAIADLNAAPTALVVAYVERVLGLAGR